MIDRKHLSKGPFEAAAVFCEADVWKIIMVIINIYLFLKNSNNFLKNSFPLYSVKSGSENQLPATEIVKKQQKKLYPNDCSQTNPKQAFFFLLI